MRRYSIDIFDRNLEFKEYKEVTATDNITYDYLSQEKLKLTVIGKINISKTDYVSLYQDEERIYQGVISDYTFDKTNTTITLLSLQSILDIDVFSTVTELNDGKISLEKWFEARLKETFNSDDTFQNIIGMKITVYSETFGTIEEDSNNVYNLYDIAKDLLKVYGIMVDMEFKISQKTIQIDIHQSDLETFDVIDTIETDVLEYSLKTSNSKLPNKILYLNSDYYDDKKTDDEKKDLTPQLTFYWHPDGFSGTVSKESSSPRLLPVSFKIKRKKAVEEKKDKDGNVTTEAKTFEQVCEEDANESMQRTSYDDELELLVKKDSMIIPINDIGSRYVIIIDDSRYYTMLTSKEIVSEATVRLTFGMARTRLTQIVRENWRITNNESS